MGRPEWRQSSRRCSTGQALPLVLCVLSIVIVVAVAAGQFGLRLVRRAHAQAAADAVALAGVSGGLQLAQQTARANNVTITSWIEASDMVTVTVSYVDARATARASRQPIDGQRAHVAALAPSTLTFRGNQRAPPRRRTEFGDRRCPTFGEGPQRLVSSCRRR